MYYVYFLLLNNDTVYKGRTTRLAERYEEHKQGKVSSTRNKRPLLLVGYEAYLLASDAVRRETFLKTTEGRRLLRQQYRDVIKRKGSEIK